MHYSTQKLASFSTTENVSVEHQGKGASLQLISGEGRRGNIALDC